MNSNQKQIAFLELYEQSRENLVRFAKAISRNSEEADDLIQETTLQAFDSFEKLKNPKAFTSYLFTIASRIHKRANWRKRLFLSFSRWDDKDTYEESMPDTGARADANYDITALYKALEKLPEAQKEAVILFEINGLSLEEIKDIQGVSLPGVKSRVQRGRQALAKILRVKDDTQALLRKEDIDYENDLAYKEAVYRNSIIGALAGNEVL